MDVMDLQDWMDLYEALPPDQKREFDRINQRADALAAQGRVERRRHEAICDAMQEALDRIQAAGDGEVGASGDRESAGQYA